MGRSNGEMKVDEGSDCCVVDTDAAELEGGLAVSRKLMRYMPGSVHDRNSGCLRSHSSTISDCIRPA